MTIDEDNLTSTHREIVLHKIQNASRYTNITNYQIARQTNGSVTSDPVATLGTNLGRIQLARSVNSHSVWGLNYHSLSQFFDILNSRSGF